MKLKLTWHADYQPEKIIRAYNQAERRVLLSAARITRVYARNAMRRRSRASRPGEGPTVRKGQLRRFLLYALEPTAGIAVVGPKRLPGVRGDTPEALEHGKRTLRTVGRGRRRRRQRVNYEPRPAMTPALQRINPDLPGMWRNSIRG